MIEAKNIADQKIADMAQAAKIGQKSLLLAGNQARDQALQYIAEGLITEAKQILDANKKDQKAAKEKALMPASIDRLILNFERIQGMAEGIAHIRAQENPVGKLLDKWTRPNGLEIEKIATPIGVIGVIFESRPNVAIDAAALAIKSGNGIILRGGSDSIYSVRALSQIIANALIKAGISAECVQIIKDTDRAMVGGMLRAQGLIDVIIPRGGKSLTERVYTDAKVPVLAHLEGIVHSYIHEKADPAKALNLIINAKMRRTGICGATECLLIDQKVAEALLPPIIAELQAKGCEIRGDIEVEQICPDITVATQDDYGCEFLDSILAVKIVANLDAAIAFIEAHGSHHTDAIITEDEQAAKRFLTEIDSAIVMHNASTQFADGGQFGMGAEIGIATGRFHARGPIGAAQLCCFHYLVHGQGQCRP